MILIAESGSTKTDWRLLCSDGEVKSFHTIGFNPYYIGKDKIFEELSKSELVDFKTSVKQVYFYGAGCSSSENCQIVSNALATFFIQSKIEVSSDMLAAARATCGNEKGIVAILGTGSNSCLYNGKEIIENVSSLGYILGDYGSGADIGKQLITAFLENELPQELHEAFDNEYGFSAQNIINSIYKEALPNRFLASFNLFVAKHIEHSYCQNIVKNRINLFIEKNILKYSDYQIINLCYVGSIAAVYETIIRAEASKRNIKIGKIIKAPIDELVTYHMD
ncbi:MAG: ATPase [Vicingaceae bacterium]